MRREATAAKQPSSPSFNRLPQPESDDAAQEALLKLEAARARAEMEQQLMLSPRVNGILSPRSTEAKERVEGGQYYTLEEVIARPPHLRWAAGQVCFFSFLALCALSYI